MIVWREAEEGDLPAILALLRDDALGATREGGTDDSYFAAFRAMQDEGANHLIVGVEGELVVATYQITFISGLSLSASRRAQIESVRVGAARRGQRLGAALMLDAEARARAAGCRLVQLTSNATRERARAFYAAQGYVPSHIGFKKALD